MNFDPRYSARNFTSVGTRPIRPDGVDKVTGRARYGADFNMAGQLVGRILRSPHAHATIRKIDTSKAEKLNGVKAVITAADLPDLTDGDSAMYDILDNCMARKKALYDGHAVAAVAAVDARTARQALKLIEVDYEVLPHVTDVDEAMKRYGARAATTPSSPRASSQSPASRPTSPSAPSTAMATSRRASGRPISSSNAPSRPSRRTRAISSRMPAWRASAPTAPPTSGSARRAISSTASTAPSCSAWTPRSCASPRRRSAAVSAARPMSGPSRSRWRCRARPAGRSSWS